MGIVWSKWFGAERSRVTVLSVIGAGRRLTCVSVSVPACDRLASKRFLTYFYPTTLARTLLHLAVKLVELKKSAEWPNEPPPPPAANKRSRFVTEVTAAKTHGKQHYSCLFLK